MTPVAVLIETATGVPVMMGTYDAALCIVAPIVGRFRVEIGTTGAVRAASTIEPIARNPRQPVAGIVTVAEGGLDLLEYSVELLTVRLASDLNTDVQQRKAST